MFIKTLASGSSGNCYIVSSNDSNILIECGIPIKKIKEGCNYKLSGMDACLISHEHKDHSKSAQDVMAVGVEVYCSAGTAQACELTGHRLHIIKAMEQFKIGQWIILPFDTKHDCAEPLGFLVANGNDKLLFATDTFYLKYKFNGLTHVMIECNYSLDTLDENIASGYVDESRRQRLLRSHMSLAQCINTLIANDLSMVKEIHLLHLSFQNSDAAEFKRAIQRATGKQVFIAGH